MAVNVTLFALVAARLQEKTYVGLEPVEPLLA